MKIEYCNNISMIDSLTGIDLMIPRATDNKTDFPKDSFSSFSSPDPNAIEYNDSEAGDLELSFLEKRRKELLVRKLHTNKIVEPTESFNCFRTRVKDAPNGRIVAKTYNDLIDKLYEHYYGSKFEVPTLREAVNEWIDSREANGTIEYLTALHYRVDFKKYLSSMPMADMKITEITKNHIINAFENIVGDGTGISKKAVNNVKTIINGAFDYANLHDGINCFDARTVKIRDLIRKCNDSKSKDSTYTREEAESIISYLSNLPPSVYSLGIMLMFCLPIRIGELRALKWEDYDRNNRLLHLNHSIVCKADGETHRKAVDVDYMKRHSDSGKRSLDISDFAAHILDELFRINGDKEYILQSKGKMPISTNNFNDHLREYCEKCGVEYKSSHKIRFYACFRMYDLGYDEKTIQKNMGHSSLVMTRHYDRRQKKTVDPKLINEAFGFEIRPLPTHCPVKLA